MASSRRTGTNENVSTYGGSGMGRDYTALLTWEQDTDNDLVTATQSEVLECYDDAASFDDVILCNGATTNSSYFRIIRPASGQGHDGTRNNGVHFSSTDASNNVLQFTTEQYGSIQDLIVSVNASSTGIRLAAYLNGNNCDLVGVIAYSVVNSGSGRGDGLWVAQLASSLINCLAHDCDDFGFFNANGAMLNCTAKDNGNAGFRRQFGTATVRNCLADNNAGGDFSGTFSTEEYNASKDATAGGTGSRINQTFTFANAAGDDFHLDAADAGARTYATDLSGTFDDDVDGETRVAWDIGFDEVLAAAGGDSLASLGKVFRVRRFAPLLGMMNFFKESRRED